MAKRPHLSVVEKITAKQAAPTTTLDAGDLHNVLIAARKGVGLLPGQDLANAGASIARLEIVLAQQQAKEQAAAPVPAATEAPAAAQAAAKG